MYFIVLLTFTFFCSFILLILINTLDVQSEAREQAAEETFQRSEKKESDIVARVEAAENKIRRNGYYGQMEGVNFNGYGTFTYADGSKYVGEWKNDKHDGNGIFTSASGNKYVGEYKNGKSDGYGTYTWADGSKYVGEWKNGQANGYATRTYPDGSKYTGQYKDNKHHGQGTYTNYNGTIKHSGEWVNGYPKK